MRSYNSKTTLTLIVLTFAAVWSGGALAEPPLAKTKTKVTPTVTKVLVPKTGQAPTLPALTQAPAMPQAVSAESRAALIAQVAVAKAELAKTAPASPPSSTTPPPTSFEIRTTAMESAPGAQEHYTAPFGWFSAPAQVTPGGASFASSTFSSTGMFIDAIPQGAYIVDCAVPQGARVNYSEPYTVTNSSGSEVAVDTITATNGRLFFATIISASKGRLHIGRAGGWFFNSCKFEAV